MFPDSDHLVFAAQQVKLARRHLSEAIRYLKAAECQVRHSTDLPDGVDAETRVLLEQLRALFSEQICIVKERIEQRDATQEIYEQLVRLAKLLRLLERSQPRLQASTDESPD